MVVLKVSTKTPKPIPYCCRKTNPQQEQVMKKRLNDFLRQMDASEFEIRIFKSVEPQTYLITVDLDEDEIEHEAQLTEYPVRLHGLSAKVPFMKGLKKKIQPFKSKDVQYLII